MSESLTQTKHGRSRALLVCGLVLSGLALVPLAISFSSLTALRADVAALPVAAVGQGRAYSETISRPQPADVDDADWSAFQDVGRDLSVLQGQLSKRFRLAGTFFMYTPQGSYYRKAILDELLKDKQLIVAEGDRLDELEVVTILRDRVIVRDEDGREIEIWQSADVARSLGSAEDDHTRQQKSGIDKDALEAFHGKYNGDNHWSFERSTLLEYYKTLHENPDRLVRVFDSMMPVRNYEQKIDGYQVGVEGEREFFAAMDLRDGDVVRSVNDVRMTNRRRAEFFLKNFAKGRNSAFILEVERNGEKAKRVYQIK